MKLQGTSQCAEYRIERTNKKIEGIKPCFACGYGIRVPDEGHHRFTVHTTKKVGERFYACGDHRVANEYGWNRCYDATKKWIDNNRPYTKGGRRGSQSIKGTT